MCKIQLNGFQKKERYLRLLQTKEINLMINLQLQHQPALSPRGNSNKAAAPAASAVIVLTSIVILYHYRVEIKNKLGLGEAPVGGGIAKLKGKAQSTKV